MALFKKAENQMAYLKAGIMGFAGSGKTYTAALMAEGIHKRIKSKKPVYFLDTETGSDFLVPMFKKWKIDLLVSKSRAFKDLLEAVKEAEKDSALLIIDSISHFWKEIMDSYQKAHNRKRLLFQDWMPIKGQWARFTDAYLNSQVHIIMNGRAGFEYDYFTDESGAKQLEKTGTKMKVETEMGYEPSLLVEMVKERVGDPNKRTIEGQLWNHTAYVLKDRTSMLEGKKFINPMFEDFKPHFDFLNIGGTHVGVDTSKDSTHLFEKDSDENFYEMRKQKTILMEEIQGDLVSAFPGQSAADKKIKADLIDIAFATRSWTKLEEYSIQRLKEGRQKIKEAIPDIKAGIAQ